MSGTSRKPPAVRYPARRSRSLAVVLWAAVLWGVSGIVAWLFSGGGAAPWWAISVALVFACVGAAGGGYAWRTQFSGDLYWDGAHWTLEPQSAGTLRRALAETPEVLVDLQRYLWLRARTAESRAVWIWLERSSCPERWLDLRRAVYSRARPGAEHVDETAPGSSRGRES